MKCNRNEKNRKSSVIPHFTFYISHFTILIITDKRTVFHLFIFIISIYEQN